MSINLTANDRADIERIICNSSSAMPETLAKHFVAVGIERAAARCDEIAAHSREGDGDDIAQACNLVASAIRALK